MSFLVDWFYDILYRFGFLHREATFLVLGLDNAGKTTFLHKLKHGSLKRFTPTERPQLMEQLEIGNVHLKAWDVGGHQEVRDTWRDFFVTCDAIIYMIDLWDEKRFEESKTELWALVEDAIKSKEEEFDLSTCLFLVVANKVDKVTDPQRPADLQRLLEIERLASHVKGVHFQTMSLYNGNGFEAGLHWLTDNL